MARTASRTSCTEWPSRSRSADAPAAIAAGMPRRALDSRPALFARASLLRLEDAFGILYQSRASRPSRSRILPPPREGRPTMPATIAVVERSTALPVSAEAAYAWHERPGAFERLLPPWEHVSVVERVGGLRDGASVILRVGSGPVSLRWVSRHRDTLPGRRFVDEQVQGPF